MPGLASVSLARSGFDFSRAGSLFPGLSFIRASQNPQPVQQGNSSRATSDNSITQAAPRVASNSVTTRGQKKSVTTRGRKKSRGGEEWLPGKRPSGPEYE